MTPLLQTQRTGTRLWRGAGLPRDIASCEGRRDRNADRRERCGKIDHVAGRRRRALPARRQLSVSRGGDITRLPSHERARLGSALVPEGRRVFPFLTVRENLELGAFKYRNEHARKSAPHGTMFDMFPRLRERPLQNAGTLSGGEQQMLALGRAMMSEPRLLCLDEPSLGLAPLVVQDIFRTIAAINAAAQRAAGRAERALCAGDREPRLCAADGLDHRPAVRAANCETIFACRRPISAAAAASSGSDCVMSAAMLTGRSRRRDRRGERHRPRYLSGLCAGRRQARLPGYPSGSRRAQTAAACGHEAIALRCDVSSEGESEAAAASRAEAVRRRSHAGQRGSDRRPQRHHARYRRRRSGRASLPST